MIEVLIIEDDPRVAEINRRFLQKTAGYQLIGIAKNKQEGLEWLKVMQPQLVLLDIYLPDGKGLDLIWEIRKQANDTDIIIISAADQMDIVQEALRGGVFDYLVKPVMFERFASSLENYIQHRKVFSKAKKVDQNQLDSLLFTQAAPLDPLHQLPKGIDRVTLDKVIESMRSNQSQGLTAEYVGGQLGMSRSTARRYLEYLVSIQLIRTDQSYGSIGRPERKYLWVSS
ncbi:two-component system, CitB family, response regulator [Marininema mesophilum]|uniref:Transcriptional regulatory protein n=1 Tax=Marininema mesophilum TaxID=1048340 RepID=A0A1H2YM49_9BACL|nr:response regulator [Marininema mesophilum]SDX05724.1 two-component system, CitB family, response regulator [Marininema mesophilum]